MPIERWENESGRVRSMPDNNQAKIGSSRPPHAAKIRPSVLVVGGGFAGIAAAKALEGAKVEVTLIDRRNHHVFQPLLYQVATASLSPADISSPIRTILRGQRNCQVAMAEITSVDVANRRLMVRGGHIQYDYLILAAGATHATQVSFPPRTPSASVPR